MSDIFLRIVELSWQAGVLALVVMAARLVLRRAPKWAICMLWALVAVRLVLPFSLQSPVSLQAEQSPVAAALEQLRADIAETAEKSIHLTPPAEIDLGWWQSHYSDIIGYVYSPGTPISYPIAYDGNNEYYLHHDLYGNYSAYGTIFLDARANRDFTSQSNMLYGHHMADGTMFASISGYKQQWYYDAHPSFYLYTNEGTYRVDLFAGLIVPGEHEVFNTSFSDETLSRFISQSTFNAGRGVPTGRIVGMCTCSYEADNYRFVVLGEMTLLTEGNEP